MTAASEITFDYLLLRDITECFRRSGPGNDVELPSNLVDGSIDMGPVVPFVGQVGVHERAPFDGPLTLQVGKGSCQVGPALASRVMVELLPD